MNDSASTPQPRSTFFKRAVLLRRCSQAFFLIVFLFLFLRVASPFRPNLIVGEGFGEYPVEFFLWTDPLVGLSALVAGKTVHLALVGLALALALSLFLPRGYCSHICPLGTLIDLTGFLQLPRKNTLRKKADGVPARSRFGVLLVVLLCGLVGIVLATYVSPLAVLFRGSAFSAGSIHFGLVRGWEEIWPEPALAFASLALLLFILILNLLGKRFWCRKFCPTGALYSLGSAFRLIDRQVDEQCIACGKCASVCRFDAVADDYSDRPTACSRCSACGAACPVDAIHYAWRWKVDAAAKPISDGPVLSRRTALVSIGGAAALAALGQSLSSASPACLRPPGNPEEETFLDLCVRCGACMRVCPGPVLHPRGLESGFEAFLTPAAVPRLAGCVPDCNLCTQACPTGAIRPLTHEEKRRFIMGTGVINRKTCLPWAGLEECRLCFEECEAAGYHAIEMRTIELEIGELPPGMFSPDEIEAMSHIQAPFVLADQCTGCGLCEYRCHNANVLQEEKLEERAVIVQPPEPGSPRWIAPRQT